MRRWRLEWDHERWPTMNESLRENRYRLAEHSEYWTAVWAQLALRSRIPTLENISVTMQGQVPHTGRRDTDADAVMVKYILDGLALAGVISDDTWKHVHHYTVFYPIMGSDHWSFGVVVKDEGEATEL